MAAAAKGINIDFVVKSINYPISLCTSEKSQTFFQLKQFRSEKAPLCCPLLIVRKQTQNVSSTFSKSLTDLLHWLSYLIYSYDAKHTHTHVVCVKSIISIVTKQSAPKAPKNIATLFSFVSLTGEKSKFHLDGVHFGDLRGSRAGEEDPSKRPKAAEKNEQWQWGGAGNNVCRIEHTHVCMRRLRIILALWQDFRRRKK